ncbi:dolichol-P-glucose synthetase [Litoreibacter roseus]|uniref:Dolichol-P-glucose synthetase n=1 Tax=Litoreibacter roseus TaxID=2601869 RepID=A0A6N6JIW9_9RHOB|nr:dolichol-P-glucose synthetase [Litoreibacter roseus]
MVDIPERGYGAALIGGFQAARGKYLVMGDSDCSYDFVESVPMVAELVNGADLCMGSRFKGEIRDGAMPWKNRYIGNPALSAILRSLVKTNVNDAHCGLRALTRDAFTRMQLTSTGMEFASEMVLKAAIMKLDIAELPVTLSPDKRGHAPHLNPWRDGFRHLFFMLMLCPAPLFFAPAAALFLAGLSVLTALILGGGMVEFAGFSIGDHWAVAASAFLILSVQIACLGLIAFAQAFRDGIRLADGLLGAFLKNSALHHWLLSGTGVALLGLVWAATIAGGWISSDFGSLDAIRPLIAAFTAVVMGVQIVFTGFLLSIVTGNRLNHSPV